MTEFEIAIDRTGCRVAREGGRPVGCVPNRGRLPSGIAAFCRTTGREGHPHGTLRSEGCGCGRKTGCG
jgi:hypothetical protein